MSPDLERQLREARELLPEPEATTTRLARGRALAAMRGRTRRLPPALALAAALLAAVVAGVVIGASTPQSVTAGRGPLGLGFIAQPGWYTLNAPGRAPGDAQLAAMAANVPFDPADDLDGLAGSSGLPYATLLGLPSHGIVLSAVFTENYTLSTAGGLASPPQHDLPLRLRDADRISPLSTQIRPEEPIAQYHIAAPVGVYDVRVYAYFGTPTPSQGMLDEAQRQLDRLILEPDSRATSIDPALTGVDVTRRSVVDQTFRCTTGDQGGVRALQLHAQSGVRDTIRGWKWLASAYVGTPGTAAAGPQHWAIAGIRAGWPPPSVSPEPLLPTTFWVGAGRCQAVVAPVSLLPRGLRASGEASVFADEVTCFPSATVLMRVRAVFRQPVSVRLNRSAGQLRTNGPVRVGRIAVRAETGEPLLLAEVFESGKTRIYQAKGCVED